jgi:O-antigen/teichoic acid export membrane protein
MEQPSTMRRDVLSAYAASFARMASWVIVSAIVYRQMGKGAFALLSFVRGTIGILNYASVALAPAMIKLLAEARAPKAVIPVSENEPSIEYATPSRTAIHSVQEIYVTGFAWGFMTCGVGLLILIGYVYWANHSREISSLVPEASNFIFAFGLGVLIDLLSDAASAVLQTSDRITLDNIFVIIGEATWAGMTAFFVYSHIYRNSIARDVGLPYCLGTSVLLFLRWFAARRSLPGTDVSRFKHLNPAILKRLLTFGSLIAVAQIADYLYSPTDFLLISLLLHPIEAATYAPAVQIDAGILLLVSGLAAVVLPKAAMAHASQDHAALRRYYFLGTLFSIGVLLFAAFGAWAIAPKLFKIWFGDKLLATRAILPLVLIHTVIGGSSSVGRSILIGMGKVGPFTAAVLIAGISNVLLSWYFVAVCGMGLTGIILGTILAVVGRCVVWMPWYVMRVLARNDQTPMTNK